MSPDIEVSMHHILIPDYGCNLLGFRDSTLTRWRCWLVNERVVDGKEQNNSGRWKVEWEVKVPVNGLWNDLNVFLSPRPVGGVVYVCQV